MICTCLILLEQGFSMCSPTMLYLLVGSTMIISSADEAIVAT